MNKGFFLQNHNLDDALFHFQTRQTMENMIMKWMRGKSINFYEYDVVMVTKRSMYMRFVSSMLMFIFTMKWFVQFQQIVRCRCWYTFLKATRMIPSCIISIINIETFLFLLFRGNFSWFNTESLELHYNLGQNWQIVSMATLLSIVNCVIEFFWWFLPLWYSKVDRKLFSNIMLQKSYENLEPTEFSVR